MLSAAQRRAIAARALTIYERLALQQADSNDRDRVSHRADETDPRGEQLLSAWNQAFAPGDREAFVRRLTWDDIDRAAVVALVTDAPTAIDAAWSTFLPLLYAGAREAIGDIVARSGSDPLCAASDNLLPARPTPRPLGDTVAFPELWRACVRGVRPRCQRPPDAFLSPDAIADLEDQLAREMAVYGDRAAFELFAALRRRIDADEQESGRSAVYDEFVIATLNEQFATLFSEYPVVARQLAQVAEAWLTTSNELCQRLACDRQLIVDTFGKSRTLGPVTRIEAGLSDPHDGRRRVAIVHFASGLRIVYKPRSLGVDDAFERLCAWFAQRGLASAPPAPRVLSRGQYGWSSFVEQGTFNTAADVARYFERAGSLLFLAHLLGARDMHLENVIAASSGPTLIDLELLLQPVAMGGTPADGDVMQRNESCLRSGLVSLVQVGADDRPYDLGGLMGTGRAHGGTTRRWTHVGTDALAFVDEAPQPLPTYNAVRSSQRTEAPAHYVTELLRGFEDAYDIAIANRVSLLASDGPLSAFRGAEIRIIVRPTEQYGLLSAVRNTPRYQRDAIGHSILVDALYRPLKEARARPREWPLVAEERRVVQALDVPRFVVKADGLTVESDGRPILHDYYGRSAIDAVRDRVSALSLDDREQQSLVLGHAVREGVDAHFSTRCDVAVPATLDADAMGTALRACASWIGEELLLDEREAAGPRPQWPVSDPSRLDTHVLYNGSTGAPLFFAALAAETGESRWDQAARRALQPCLDCLASAMDGAVDRASAGGLAGTGSLVMALTSIAQLLSDTAILERANGLVAGLGTRAAHRGACDVVDGSAGALLASLALFRATGDQRALDEARLCGDHLVSAQVPRPSGAAWPAPNGRCLTGFAHGAAGIAAALTRLARVTACDRYADAARRGFDFVASQFSAVDGNWAMGEADPANIVTAISRMSAWCHGAPGIALAAKNAAESIHDAAVVSQAAQALLKVGRWEPTQADHLCCGHLGRADVLLTVGHTLGVQDATTAASAIAGRVLMRARERQHFRLSTPGFEYRVHDRGFFRGLSGIGYQLLRMSAPRRVPSILAFESIEQGTESGATR